MDKESPLGCALKAGTQEREKGRARDGPWLLPSGGGLVSSPGCMVPTEHPAGLGAGVGGPVLTSCFAGHSLGKATFQDPPSSSNWLALHPAIHSALQPGIGHGWPGPLPLTAHHLQLLPNALQLEPPSPH